MLLLRISVTFFDPVTHCGRADGRLPEWPPSPYRVFCAVLAGAHAARRGLPWDSTPYLWWERQPAPTIVAPRAETGRSYVTAVPPNDADTAARALARGRMPRPEDLDEGRRAEKQRRPTHLLDGSTVHYIWKIEAGDVPNARRILEDTRHLTALGHGIDQAFAEGAVIEEGEFAEPGVRWWPLSNFDGVVRIPVAGTLAELDELYQRACNRFRDKAVENPDRPKVLRTIHYNPEFASMPRPYAAFTLRPRIEDEHPDAPYFAWWMREAVDLAKAVRLCASAAATEEGLSEEEIRRFVNGHVATGDNDRLSYFCLPTTGERYGDGRIRRVAVVEPQGGSGKHVEWLRRRLTNRHVITPHGTFGGRLVPIIEGDSDVFDGILGIYRKASRTWATVTPAILPYRTPLKECVPVMLKHAELPHSARWKVLNGSLWRGNDVRRYSLPKYLRDWPQVHLKIEFEAPMLGPFSIGSGRHVGLGVMAGCDDVPLPI